MYKEEEVYGIKYKTPNVPKHEDIDNWDIEQADQKFYKLELSDIFEDLEFDEDENALYSDEQREFVVKEWNKIKKCLKK